MLKWLGQAITTYLMQPDGSCYAASATPIPALVQSARAGDVLLVEGNQRVSTAIKYLTQSTWSHAALCIGPNRDTAEVQFIENDAKNGVHIVSAGFYKGFHMRLCRPVGLAESDIAKVVEHAKARIGNTYDLRNVIDLARYLFPTPPVPVAWRRRMIALGSGDPTKAICSSLIAEAFQHVNYPVLPRVTIETANDPDCDECTREILHIRHSSLFTPRDFDVSPYFEVIKPNVQHGFDFRQLAWAENSP